MALADLLAALARDADAEVHAAADAAARDAEKIEAEAARQCVVRLEAALREITERERAKHAAHLAETTQRCRRAVLEARAAMLERLRSALRDILPSFVDAELRARFAEAASAFGDGARRDVPTGVVIELDGGTRVEASLEATLAVAWPRLAAEALALVDGATA